MVTLVTGGTGFVGSNVVKALAEKGHSVLSVDIEPAGELVREYLGPWSERVNWEKGELLSRDSMEGLTATPTIEKIVHAATYTIHDDELEKMDGRRVVDINVMGTVNVLELARRLKVRRLLFVSTAGVYEGVHTEEDSLKEELPLYPAGLYRATKHAGELLSRRYGELHGFETVSVRFGNVYGPMERVTPYRSLMSVPYHWTRSAVKGEPIRALPDRYGFDLLYVRDAAEAIRLLLDAPELEHPVYNIAAGRVLHLADLVEAMREACPGVTFEEPLPQEEGQLVSIAKPLDPSRISEELGWAPRYDIVSGLRDYMMWRRDFTVEH